MFSKIFPRENLGRVKVPSLAIRFAEASSFRRGFLLGMEIVIRIRITVANGSAADIQVSPPGFCWEEF
jgi:hypothetical protein